MAPGDQSPAQPEPRLAADGRAEGSGGDGKRARERRRRGAHAGRTRPPITSCAGNSSGLSARSRPSCATRCCSRNPANTATTRSGRCCGRQSGRSSGACPKRGASCGRDCSSEATSMSDERLDRLIDDVARQMTAGHPSSDFRRARDRQSRSAAPPGRGGHRSDRRPLGRSPSPFSSLAVARPFMAIAELPPRATTKRSGSENGDRAGRAKTGHDDSPASAFTATRLRRDKTVEHYIRAIPTRNTRRGRRPPPGSVEWRGRSRRARAAAAGRAAARRRSDRA